MSSSRAHKGLNCVWSDSGTEPGSRQGLGWNHPGLLEGSHTIMLHEQQEAENIFFGCTHGIHKFPGQGSNLGHSSDPSCYSDNTWILNPLSHKGTPPISFYATLALVQVGPGYFHLSAPSLYSSFSQLLSTLFCHC